MTSVRVPNDMSRRTNIGLIRQERTHLNLIPDDAHTLTSTDRSIWSSFIPTIDMHFYERHHVSKTNLRTARSVVQQTIRPAMTTDNLLFQPDVMLIFLSFYHIRYSLHYLMNSAQVWVCCKESSDRKWDWKLRTVKNGWPKVQHRQLEMLQESDGS